MNANHRELIERLAGLLQDSARLGLTFSRGNAYISADYVEQQSAILDGIRRALADVDSMIGPPADPQ